MGLCKIETARIFPPMPEQRKYSILKHLFGLVAIIFTLPCLGQPVDTARIPLNLPGTQKMEIADFNFDGYTDYRIGTINYTTKFDYYTNWTLK